jgi:tetratricopeptide (TPR) repeat protein
MRGVAVGMSLLFLFTAGLASEADWEDCRADDPERSIGGCTRVISEAKEPHILAVAYNNRGVAYKARGELLRAFVDYTEAVRLNPAYARAFYNRALAYLETKAFARALDDFDAALRIDPNYAKALASRAMLLAENDEIKEAFPDFERALALEPNLHLPPNKKLAEEIIAAPLWHEWSNSERRVVITVAIKLDPQNAELYNGRAALHFEVRAFDEAIADLNEAIRLSPHNADAFLNRCRAYLEAGNPARAVEDCKETIRLSPTSGSADIARRILNLKPFNFTAKNPINTQSRFIPWTDLMTCDYNKFASAPAVMPCISLKEKVKIVPVNVNPEPSIATGPTSLEPSAPEPLVAAAAKCDEMASFQFDPDRPPASKWQESQTKISPLADAFSACQTALQQTEALPDGPEKNRQFRRLLVELGRVHAAKAHANAVSGNRGAASASFAEAVKLWKKAAKLDSGQAFNLLGGYYSGIFAVSNANADPFIPAETPNLHLAWTNYQEAARLKSDWAALAGLILTGLDRRDWKLPVRDEKKGREYLEEARRLQVPKAYYGLGAAMIQGKATEKEGIRLLSIAYCKGISEAIELFERRKYKKPTQCEG